MYQNEEENMTDDEGKLGVERKLDTSDFIHIDNVGDGSRNGKHDTQEEDVIVVRLNWESRLFAHVVSESLVRDHILALGHPYPSISSQISINYFNVHPIKLTIVSSIINTINFKKDNRNTKLTIYVLPCIAPWLLESLNNNNSNQLTTSSFSTFLSYLIQYNLTEKDPIPFRIPKNILLNSSYDTNKLKHIVNSLSSTNFTFIYTTASHLLSRSSSCKTFFNLLLSYIKAAGVCEPAVLFLDDVHFLFPNDDKHGLNITIPVLIDYINQQNKSIIVIMGSCEPVCNTLNSCIDIRFNVNDMNMNGKENHHQHKEQEENKCSTSDYKFKETEKQWNNILNELPGSENALRLLKRIVRPHRHRSHYHTKIKGIKLPRGALLYGVPGTGKTKIMEKVCKVSRHEIINVEISEILYGEVGESENKLKQVFYETNKQSNNKLIMFDEIESLFMNHKKSPDGLRLINVFCKCMDDYPNIKIVGITNKPWMIHKMLRRSGRFDYCIKMNLPNYLVRSKIMQSVVNTICEECHDVQFEQNAKSKLFVSVQAARFHGFTGADLTGICRRIIMNATWRHDNGIPKSTVGTALIPRDTHGLQIVGDDVSKAVRSAQQSVSLEEINRIDSWANND